MYMLPTTSSMLTLPSWYGCITSPAQWGRKPITHESRQWCMDNGVYTGRFDPATFTAALDKLQPHASTCRFVAAPDVVGDAAATLALWPTWQPIIAARGYPVAFVAQDGLTPEQMPHDADALFIGGSTDWKLGPDTRALIAEAKRRGLWVHVGRVNSQLRIRRFALAGADSADGTHSAFMGVPRTVALFNQALNQPPLWRGNA